MPEPLNVNFIERGCRNKRRYKDRRSAKKAAKSYARAKEDRIYPYWCRLCHSWHLGHSKSKDKRKEGGK